MLRQWPIRAIGTFCHKQRKGRMACGWDTDKWIMALQRQAPRAPVMHRPSDLSSGVGNMQPPAPIPTAWVQRHLLGDLCLLPPAPPATGVQRWLLCGLTNEKQSCAAGLAMPMSRTHADGLGVHTINGEITRTRQQRSGLRGPPVPGGYKKGALGCPTPLPSMPNSELPDLAHQKGGRKAGSGGCASSTPQH